MSPDSGIDVSKSLAELSGVDWGPPPVEAGILVRERYELRRRPVAQLSHAELIRLLDMNYDGDSVILIPVALERLRSQPALDGGAGEGDLLCAVLRHPNYPWRTRPECVHDVRLMVDKALNDIAQTTDDYERVRAERDVYRCYAIFERRLSAVP